MSEINTGTALVLGGGGVAGIAWELGVLLGLAESGVNLTDAGLVVGTSAGACVGAQITSSTPVETLYNLQLDPGASANEQAVEFDMASLIAIFQELESAKVSGEKTAALARVGAMAIAAPTPPEAERLAIIASRLPSAQWPTRRLLITTVDAHSGEFVVFDSMSGISLIDAVAASCAVPGVWPPVTIGDKRYIDGGVHSPINADLAVGSAKAVILLPMGGESEAIGAELASLQMTNSEVLLMRADEASIAAFGLNPLDPATRTPSALAGRAQGRFWALEVGNFWN
jgi:NTE family protein